MKIQRLHLKNYRCFDELVLEFDDRLTVFVAENGSGKTALLDAIAIGLGRYLTKVPGIEGRASKETDLRITDGERRAPFMLLAWEARTYDGRGITWYSGRKRDAAVSAAAIKEQLAPQLVEILAHGSKRLDDYVLELVRADAEQRPYFLPVVAYYGTNRAIRDEVKRRRGFRKRFTRFDALAGALEPDSRFRAAFEWFNAMEDEERREREARRDFSYRHPALQAVREALERLLPDYRNPRTEIRPLRFVIDKVLPDGRVERTLRVSQLSDGYRVVLGLVMDLARRMVQANAGALPEHLSSRHPLDLPAIVLIDEVDLHLHPSWQQRIIADLMRTFTDTQFILTTHSPQVLSTVRREHIRVIGPDSEGRLTANVPLAMTYGEPSGDVLHSVMLVDPQPPIAEKADLQRLTEWVDQGHYDKPEAQDLMARLCQALGERHPQLLRLQRSIQRQEALRKA
ncbi:MAG: AAA family ATPase [Tepidimonas sp.]|uniref:AAA family ATPase n=1 Tax=Tepidimonas sp. TaxID=2002775 RepID=UPI00298F2507|nr:AAA family ATPase [Tepidimonas sp.]MDW8336959.1 AAA family ATPase [Tepidimonas sp.]